MADKKPGLWDLANVEDAAAIYFDGHLILSVSGKKPTPCYRVRIEQSPLTVEPPTFVVEWQSSGSPCPDVITPYQRTAVFSIGTYRETVNVVSAEGTKSVKVKKLDATTGLADKAAHRTATGYSATFSFEDAFEDAIGKLPPLHPDELQHFVVTNTGAVVGGFLGLKTLFVTVRTP